MEPTARAPRALESEHEKDPDGIEIEDALAVLQLAGEVDAAWALVETWWSGDEHGAARLAALAEVDR